MTEVDLGPSRRLGSTLGIPFVAEGEEEGADLSTRLELLSLPGQVRGQPRWPSVSSPPTGLCVSPSFSANITP